MINCIVRGTTDTLDFVLDTDLSNITAMEITFAQYGFERFTKTLDEVTIDGQTISVPLSQEDTLKLKAKDPLSIQIRVLFASGEADATDIVRMSVGEILKGGILTNVYASPIVGTGRVGYMKI